MGLPLKHFLRAIDRGEYDHRLEDLVPKVEAEVQRRQGAIRIEMVTRLKKGNLVRVKKGKSVPHRPRFTGGRTGKVIGTKGTLVEIEYDRPFKRPSGVYVTGFIDAYYVEKL